VQGEAILAHLHNLSTTVLDNFTPSPVICMYLRTVLGLLYWLLVRDCLVSDRGWAGLGQQVGMSEEEQIALQQQMFAAARARSMGSADLSGFISSPPPSGDAPPQ
jgi:hypothetical protein